MTQGTPKNTLSNKEKASVLLIYLNNKEPGIAKSILSYLEFEKSKEVLQVLKQAPIYDEESIRDVLDEFHKMAIENHYIFPGNSMVKELQDEVYQTEIDMESAETDKVGIQLLETIEKEKLIELVEQEPPHFAALLCYLSDQNETADMLSLFPPELGQQIMSTYINLSPPSDELLAKFYDFFKLRVLEKPTESHSENLKKLTRIVELSEPELITKLEETLSEEGAGSWSTIKQNLLVLEDISKFPRQDLEKIFSKFKEPKNLAILITLIPEEAQETVKSLFSERLRNILEEESRRLKTPIPHEDVRTCTKEFIQTIRIFQDEEEITQYKNMQETEAVVEENLTEALSELQQTEEE
ncbi:hypothetical protein DID77_01195 [Candidatus Marinamargulisbacteria bacterium SCGC AG-439-L15]|nr:hypothetical protein DID77_01195 [Candidatus Marinamargulisbacteria bacterium SCGC AG-439-L15]